MGSIYNAFGEHLYSFLVYDDLIGATKKKMYFKLFVIVSMFVYKTIVYSTSCLIALLLSLWYILIVIKKISQESLFMLSLSSQYLGVHFFQIHINIHWFVHVNIYSIFFLNFEREVLYTLTLFVSWLKSQ